MVDSIGRFPVGKSPMVGRKRKDFLKRTIQKMEQWRDKARINLFQQRGRYKQKIESNQALMRAKKAGRLPNLNPTANLDNLGFKPKSVHRFEITHSTVPLKPKYSIVKPAERIYGNKWKKFENKARKSQALRKNQSKNGILKALLKKKKEDVKRE